MKTEILSLLIGLYCTCPAHAQTSPKAEPFIEGGKVIVELVKALNLMKDGEKGSGCKNSYADLCIMNGSMYSMTVSMEHRVTGQRREVVVMPEGRECFLQTRIGVWTFDLKITGTTQAVRKGDILIEDCHNMDMSIK